MPIEKKTKIVVLCGKYKIFPNKKLLINSFYTVFEGECMKTREKRCVKVVKKRFNERDMSCWVEKEIEINQKLNHENILNVLDHIKTNSFHYLITDYHDGQTLKKFIDSGAIITEERANEFLFKMARVFEHMNAKKIFHMNIKPENILVFKRINLNAQCVEMDYKLMDFGFFRRLTFEEHENAMCGNIFYMAPEIIIDRIYSYKADIWSIGAIVYELCFRKRLTRSNNLNDLIKEMQRGDFSLNDVEHKFSNTFKNVILKMVEKNFYSRMTPKEFHVCDFKFSKQDIENENILIEKLNKKILDSWKEYFDYFQHQSFEIQKYIIVDVDFFGQIHFKSEWSILDEMCFLQTDHEFQNKSQNIVFFLKLSHIMIELAEIYKKYKKELKSMYFYKESMKQLRNANNLFNQSKMSFHQNQNNMSKWIALRFKILIYKLNQCKKNPTKEEIENNQFLIENNVFQYVNYLNDESKYNQYVENQMDQTKYMLERSCILIQYLIQKCKKNQLQSLKKLFQKTKKQLFSIKQKNNEHNVRITLSPFKNIKNKLIEI